MGERGHLTLERTVPRESARAIGTDVDPVMLEIFNSLFMSIAEQMGAALQNTASSVNIKERLDFSCAVFDGAGNLVANAPHIPVHLGSMGESVKSIIASRTGTMHRGDAYMLNAPYNGGTHLPDITVITPVFGDGDGILFYVASRGHHADIGGITPGSMPPHSRTVEEEGVLIDDFLLVEAGNFREAETYALLTGNDYPARNPRMNIADSRPRWPRTGWASPGCGGWSRSSVWTWCTRTCATCATMRRRACADSCTASPPVSSAMPRTTARWFGSR
jgi:5-oxoprolinase (ATP-hydrolysing)